MICDRVMYGSLLALIVFLPYSLAMISAFEVIISLTWLAKRWISQKWEFKPNSMTWPLIALGLLILLTIPWSHFPSLSFKKFSSRFLFQILLMGVVMEVISSRKRLYVVLGVLLFTVFFTCVDALGQYAWAHYHDQGQSPLLFGRVSGPMHHPNDFGTLLVTVLPVVLILMINCRRWLPFGMAFLVLIGTLGLTSSRGAWVAFAVSMMALGLIVRRRNVIIPIFLMLVMFFWGFGMYCLGTRIDIYSVSMQHGPHIRPSFGNPWGLPEQYNPWALLSSSSGRELYWDTAINVIKTSPVFGCGYSAYLKTLNDMQISGTEYPHNSILHITAELGILGLIFYLWLFGALCQQAWKILQKVSADKDLYVLGCGLCCGILAWMIHSLVDTPWSSLQLSILVWLLIGILLSLENKGVLAGTQKGRL